MTYILGINAYHGDSSACLIKDGKIIMAVEEERFNRIKHWSGFPKSSIDKCLRKASINLNIIDYIAVNRDPRANIIKKIKYVLFKKPSLKLIVDRIRNSSKWSNIIDEFAMNFDKKVDKNKFYFIEHHRAHLASSFFVSPFKKAALLSIDGFGDFVSTMTGIGENSKIDIYDKVFFPHSLGIFYQAITQFIGFRKYGDEYKVMGLNPYGENKFESQMNELVSIKDDFFELNLDYFVHHREDTDYRWNNCAPYTDKLYNKTKFERLFGPEIESSKHIIQRQKDIARSLQLQYEKIFFYILNKLYNITKCDNLCLAGGCAMNSVANGKIYEKTPFKKVYIQAAAGDAGGAIGSAYYVYNSIKNNNRNFIMDKTFYGEDYSDEEILKLIESKKDILNNNNLTFEKYKNDNKLIDYVASKIIDGCVVGWFQDRMEWGPRALGNRSILCDPTNKNMKEIINKKIKKRESFRPFAPVVAREAVSKYFENDDDVPFMLQVYKWRQEYRNFFPAVVHVDGSGRLQTITQNQNPKYYKLIKRVEELNGHPILLNTSFNENEPIVNTPQEAFDCFLRTEMDLLVMNNYIIKRN